ncbi:chorion class A protein Ld19-like [Aricia agestis]|uniref:chorion class A protein Ld19-like n=1 Tax=Aricia agestis TaxID=91739 RepID=UPI001C203B72|nr:chorion class A protein Ld19-like [Aricia agestis]
MFALLLLAIQACMLQNVYSQCAGAAWPAAAIGAGAWPAAALGAGAWPAAGIAPAAWELGAPGLALAAPAVAVGPAYGGAGVGEVAVAGELPAAGSTLVAGQVPVLGGVEFGGVVPAAGTISIGGSCACGCGGPLVI